MQFFATPAHADGRRSRGETGFHKEEGDSQSSQQSFGEHDSGGSSSSDSHSDFGDGGGSSHGDSSQAGGGQGSSESGDSERGSWGQRGDSRDGDVKDDGSDNEAQNNGGHDKGGQQTRGQGKDDRHADDTSKPPRTVEQWLKRMFKNPQPEHQPDQKRPLQTHAPPEEPAFGGGRPEVLAVNVSPAALRKAQGLGFRVAPPTSLASLAFSVTRLLPPEGMGAADAEHLLAEQLPSESFGLNQKYRIYRTATGISDDEANASGARSGKGAACTGDHCFPREIIGWKPEEGRCAAGVRIGIIDTSVDTHHPTFAHKPIEINHLAANGAPGPDWHGTGVTALLAGDSLSGTPGLVPNAEFIVADIFHADTDGQPASDTVSMLKALDWLEAKHVQIVNMSLSGPKDDLVSRAISKLSANGVLFVAAAGNDGPAAGPSYPAAYNDVIAVTAVGRDLKNYRYANRGDYIDVAAPGVSIWTALPGAKEGYHSGTSFATPYVTAALAAIYRHKPIHSPADALSQLAFMDLGAPGRDPIYGDGLLLAPTGCHGDRIAQSTRSPARSSDAPQTTSSLPVASPPATETLPWLTLQERN